MIRYENDIFLIQDSFCGCLIRMNEYGLGELLHFGEPVQFEDAAAFCLQPSLGWGESVLLNEADTASCADVLPLIFSGCGRGDYRESPIEISEAPLNLTYTGFRILSEYPDLGSLPGVQDVTETLELSFAQPGLTLRLYFAMVDGVLVRGSAVENTGTAPMALTKLMSTMLDLPGDFHMTTFDGGWIAEMRKHTLPVLRSRVVNESVTGFSSHRHNPGFLLSRPEATEDSGVVYGCNLVYSGNHYASAQQSLQGLTRVMQGISPSNFRWQLQPGEVFLTPQAVMAFSGEGFGGVSRRMHDFVNNHIVPKAWQYQLRPVLYNDWEGCMFDFTQRSLLHLGKKAKDLGCELFVLDDGWFGKRDSDTAGLGDYSVNKKKLPGGLRALADRIRAMGMEFGLWFEPESVNVDSDLYRAHPDWALTDAFEPVFGRNQLLLDLTKPEVRDYIVENVSRIIDEAGITYVKWDMNRHSVALGQRAHQYILGLYDVLRRIFVPRPKVLLESCSSGGNRFDLGMLCFGPQIWCSDNTDPVERMDIQGNLSYLYPQSTFGAHVSAAPHAQTLRVTPLETRGNVSFFGCLGYELDLNHLLAVEETEIKAQVSLYKRYRRAFQFGTFHRLENGWQVTDGSVTMAVVFHGCRRAAPGYEYLRLKKLPGNKIFRLQSRQQNLRIGQFGALVKHVSPVSLNPNGLVLRTVDRHFTLPDGMQETRCSGAALTAGIPLLPAFRGTGYSRQQRTQLDFGSNLYIVEACDESDA